MTMDHCLRIPEVVCCICETLDGRTALSLALAQKAFLEPALDRVWRRITSFEPLVACLPDDLLRGEEKDMFLGPMKGPSQVMFLERALKLSDLQRYLNFYSHRVKSFRLCPETCRAWLSIEVLQAMQIATDWAPGALTPRLDDFLWLAPYQLLQVYGEGMASHFPLCMPLFFGPTVTSMELQIHVHNPLYTSFVDSVSRSLPSQLKKLRIEIEDTQEEDSEEEKTFPFVHEYLTRTMWPKLEELRVGGFFVSPTLTSSLFRHLATLPRMAVLELEDFVDAPSSDTLEESDPAPIDQPTIGADGFESLKRLRLSCDRVFGITRFLRCLPPTNGVTHLECECYDLTSSEDAQHAIDAMQHHLNPLALQELTLQICYFGDGDEGIRLERDEDGTLDTTPLLAASSGHDDSGGLVIDALLAFHKLVKLELQRWRLPPRFCCTAMRNYAQSCSLPCTGVRIVFGVGEVADDCGVPYVVVEDRECDKLSTAIHSLNAQLALRPPVENVEEMQQENKNLDLILQGTQRENERRMAELKRRVNARSLCRIDPQLCSVALAAAKAARVNYESSLERIERIGSLRLTYLLSQTVPSGVTSGRTPSILPTCSHNSLRYSRLSIARFQERLQRTGFSHHISAQATIIDNGI